MEGGFKLSGWLVDLCNRFFERFSPVWTASVARLSPILRRIAAIWSKIWHPLVRAPWLCAYDTLAAILASYLFIANDQGQDLLRISAEQGLSSWNLMFFVGAAALSLILWYTARLLLGRRFESFPLELSHVRWLHVWLPRAFGLAVPLAIAIGLAKVHSGSHQTEAWILCGLYVLLGFWVLWFVSARRRLFKIPADALIGNRVDALGRCDLALIWGAGVLSFLLLAAFMVWPVGLPRFLGAPAIIVLGLAGIALFGSMVLTYAFLAYGQPAGTALVLVLAVIFAFWNDNHWVRTVEDDGSAGEAAARERLSPDEYYPVWRGAHADFTPVEGRTPLILVAAAGGGIRAAYWTASALATMDAIPGFNDNLFAISGVSGGSLGAATYAAVKRRRLESGEPRDARAEVRRILGKDFLSPVVAGLLFPDLGQRFLPFPIAAADRQRFLELSWEDAFGPAPNPFTRSFTELYGQGLGTRLPSLLLNATVVDSGRRAIVSNMKTSAFADTVDLLADGFSSGAVKLSAAAGMSARFTYVSPPGSLLRPYESEGEEREVKMRVVDGGYFENSGAATLMDLLDALERKHQDLYPILILIRNDPRAPFVCHRSGEEARPLLDDGPEGPSAGDFLAELAAPVRALLNARTARGRLAEVDAARSVEGKGAPHAGSEHEAARKVQQLGGTVIEISLAAVLGYELRSAGKGNEEYAERLEESLRKQAIEPPLGWSLSEEVRTEMDEVLNEEGGGLKRELDLLSAVLRGKVVAERDRCDAR
jgi:hypothetical protein